MDYETFTETFLFVCYKAGLTKADLDEMTIGMCFDYIDLLSSDENDEVVEASQSHFDKF